MPLEGRRREPTGSNGRGVFCGGGKSLYRCSTIFGHTEAMPDDERHFSVPSPAPERIDLAALKTDLEFAIGQLSRLHKQLARAALGIIFSTATSRRF